MIKRSVQLIIDALKENKAVSIIELVDRFSDKMNKTTVYRILDRLEKSGILHSFLDQKGILPNNWFLSAGLKTSYSLPEMEFFHWPLI